MLCLSLPKIKISNNIQSPRQSLRHQQTYQQTSASIHDLTPIPKRRLDTTPGHNITYYYLILITPGGGKKIKKINLENLPSAKIALLATRGKLLAYRHTSAQARLHAQRVRLSTFGLRRLLAPLSESTNPSLIPVPITSPPGCSPRRSTFPRTYSHVLVRDLALNFNVSHISLSPHERNQQRSRESFFFTASCGGLGIPETIPQLSPTMNGQSS